MVNHRVLKVKISQISSPLELGLIPIYPVMLILFRKQWQNLGWQVLYLVEEFTTLLVALLETDILTINLMCSDSPSLAVRNTSHLSGMESGGPV